jgi:uncharacterized protein with FMN-binding domain
MKKVLVGLGVIIIFIAYSLWVRHEQPKVGTVASTVSPTTNGLSSATNNNGSSTTPPPLTSSGSYKNGTFTGDSADASYGNVQVAAIISGGKLVDVTVLQYPNSHDTSVAINQQALPMLKQEAIQAQDPNNIQIISGATFTSQAFIQSLTTALNKAQSA